jgi:hypothetical protein
MRALSKSHVLASVLGLMLLSAATSYGAIIATHRGASDPTTEPGLVVCFGNGALGTPVSLDLGTTDAWAVNSNSTMIGHVFTAGELAMAANGWSMTATVRLTAASSGVNDNLLYCRVNDERYMVKIQTDANTIPTASVWPGTATYTVGDAGYHEYKLVVNNGLADLFVDGVERIANVARDYDVDTNQYAGFVGSSANWSSFTLTVVPEPGSLTLSVVGILGLLAYAWRKRR